MKFSRKNQLEAIKASRKLVRLNRRFENSHIRGYVLAVGESFFLLALVSDRLWFDGFECFRIKDVESIDVDPYRAFAESALKKRGLRRPRTPRVVVDTAQTILASVGSISPLVTIHREENDPDICHIGRVMRTTRTDVDLVLIGPDATWDEIANSYPLREITRINFGGSYEEALFLVGGSK